MASKNPKEPTQPIVNTIKTTNYGFVIQKNGVIRSKPNKGKKRK